MTTVVLGAGATRGASFTEKQICKPPLNSDFFAQLQKVQHSKHDPVIRQVIEDTATLFSPSVALTLEECFTSVEGLADILKLRQRRTESQRRDRINQMRKNLIQAIASVFEESLCDRFVARYDAKTCEYHKTLVASLEKRDTILSFNYDCLIDQHLKQFGSGKWCARYGYGLPPRWRYPGVNYWESSKPSSGRESIMLLKLHGSLNWQVDEANRSVQFKTRPYTRQYGNMRFSIIPPEVRKVVRPPYKKLWERAARALGNTDVLVFVGFSFIATDIEALSLFRIMTNTKLRRLIIVNPDPTARRRTKEVLTKSISASTRMLDFDSLAEYAIFLDSTMVKGSPT